MVSAFLDYYVHLFTSTNFIYKTTKRNSDEINQSATTLYPTATTRLPAFTVSQPAVMPTTCHVIH